MVDSSIDTSKMIPIQDISSAADIEHRDEVIELAERAQAYIGSMSWCKEIVNGWLDYACGYIAGVFYFQILPAYPDVPSDIWVIVGDLPPAYMEAELCSNGCEAMELYIDGAQEWVDRVLEGRTIDDTVMPVNVPPEKKWAEELQGRLRFLREHILNDYEQSKA